MLTVHLLPKFSLRCGRFHRFKKDRFWRIRSFQYRQRSAEMSHRATSWLTGPGWTKGRMDTRGETPRAAVAPTPRLLAFRSGFTQATDV